MGSAFRLPLWTNADFADVLRWCAARGLRSVATDLRAGEIYTEIDWTQAHAIICGAEADGLTAAEAEAADVRVHIPMRPRCASCRTRSSIKRFMRSSNFEVVKPFCDSISRPSLRSTTAPKRSSTRRTRRSASASSRLFSVSGFAVLSMLQLYDQSAAGFIRPRRAGDGFVPRACVVRERRTQHKAPAQKKESGW